jgi:hypothetical protein
MKQNAGLSGFRTSGDLSLRGVPMRVLRLRAIRRRYYVSCHRHHAVARWVWPILGRQLRVAAAAG